MGEGLYECPIDGEQLPGMRPEKALAEGQWNIPCPECGGPLELQATPERISNPQNAYGMSKPGEEMVAINLGRRYGIPTVALRYSIVQGPRQSVYNAYSGACRIFCLSYLQGIAPTLYEDGEAIRDYVNIDDVVDANMLALEDDRAAGRVFNVGGGIPVTTREFADIVMRQYGSAQAGMVTGEYRFGDTRHILSDISALRALGWEPRRTPAESVAAYAAWLKAWMALMGCWPRRARGCAPSGSSGGRRCEGLPPRRRNWQPPEAHHRYHPEVHAGHRRPAIARHLARGVRSRGCRRGTHQPPPPAGRSTPPPHSAQRAAGGPHGLRRGVARQRRHARSPTGNGSTAKNSSWPATQTTSRTSIYGRSSTRIGNNGRSRP